MNAYEIAEIIVVLFGGLAFFLYGMSLMTDGLEKMAGGRLESILKSASSSKVKGIALGAGVTAVIQKSKRLVKKELVTVFYEEFYILHTHQ